MGNMPPPIREFIYALTDETLAPAYLLVDEDARLKTWGGAVESYGLIGLTETLAVDEHFPFLMGILPLDSGSTYLPNVQTQNEVFADVYLFRRDEGVWVLFLDTTASVKKRQAMQQRTYDLSLHATELEEEGRALLDVNSMLEGRVREQTKELSETVRRLQQELAEGRTLEKVLKASEARFRSLYENDVVGVVFLDDNGRISNANSAFLRMLGYSEEDLENGIYWNQITEPMTAVASAADGENPDSSGLPDSGSNTLSLSNSPADKPHTQKFFHKDGREMKLLFGASRMTGSENQTIGFVMEL
jgi:PAS domain-containing protein